jgi:hypothetical protein
LQWFEGASKKTPRRAVVAMVVCGAARDITMSHMLRRVQGRAIWNTNNRIVVNGTHTAGNNPGTEESGLVDIFLLANCFDVLISLSSSYGNMAAAIGGKHPVVLNPIYRAGEFKYWRSLDSEPCMFHGELLINDNSTIGKMYRGIEDYLWHAQCQSKGAWHKK